MPTVTAQPATPVIEQPKAEEEPQLIRPHQSSFQPSGLIQPVKQTPLISPQKPPTQDAPKVQPKWGATKESSEDEIQDEAPDDDYEDDDFEKSDKAPSVKKEPVIEKKDTEESPPMIKATVHPTPSVPISQPFVSAIEPLDLGRRPN